MSKYRQKNSLAQASETWSRFKRTPLDFFAAFSSATPVWKACWLQDDLITASRFSSHSAHFTNDRHRQSRNSGQRALSWK
eukprot:7228768-Lingulodinium_polyedra.AAC.1